MSVLNEVLKEYGWGDRITEDNQENLNNISLLPSNELTEFVGVIGKIVKQYLFDCMYNREDNAFSEFFGEMLAVGETIEDLYIDLIEGASPTWEDDGKNALSRVKPDIKTLYHTINYEQQYKVTTSYAQAKRAFMSEQGVENLMMKILNTLITSSEYDLYLQCCELISVMHKDGVFTDIKVDGLDSETNIKSTLKTIKKTIKDMGFMTNKYNASKHLNKTDKENLVILMPVDNENIIDVDLLSGIYNIDKMELSGKIIPIQADTGLGTLLDTTNTICIAMDKRALRIIPTLYETSSQYNASGLYTNTFLTVQFIFSYSTFFNAVRFTTDDPPESTDDPPESED